MRISICIPQYNRWRHLVYCLESIRQQTYHDIEVVVCDDGSTDESRVMIPAFLQKTGLRYIYHEQTANVGYDRNLRSTMELATGEYVFLMGNDDALLGDDAMALLIEDIRRWQRPEVGFVNWSTWDDQSKMVRRTYVTGVLGQGPKAALNTFRSFAIVTGLFFKRNAFRRHNTAKYDGSIYVQIYLAARILADGGRLLGIDRNVVCLGVHLDGKRANHYFDILKARSWRLAPEYGGLDAIARVAVEAIAPCVSGTRRKEYVYRVYSQILAFPYPYWLFEYRRNRLGRYAVNLAVGCSPAFLLRGVELTPLQWLKLSATYAISTFGGLLVPVRVLALLKDVMHRRSKRSMSSGLTSSELA